MIVFLLVFALLQGFSLTATSAAGKKTVKLSKDKVTLTVGGSCKLKLQNAKGTIKWSSSKKAVAKVNSVGKVTAKKAGNAVITAKYKKKKYTCKVTVNKKSSTANTNQSSNPEETSNTNQSSNPEETPFIPEKYIYTSPVDGKIFECEEGTTVGRVTKEWLPNVFPDTEVYLPEVSIYTDEGIKLDQNIVHEKYYARYYELNKNGIDKEEFLTAYLKFMKAQGFEVSYEDGDWSSLDHYLAYDIYFTYTGDKKISTGQMRSYTTFSESTDTYYDMYMTFSQDSLEKNIINLRMGVPREVGFIDTGDRFFSGNVTPTEIHEETEFTGNASYYTLDSEYDKVSITGFPDNAKDAYINIMLPKNGHAAGTNFTGDEFRRGKCSYDIMSSTLRDEIYNYVNQEYPDRFLDANITIIENPDDNHMVLYFRIVASDLLKSKYTYEGVTAYSLEAATEQRKSAYVFVSNGSTVQVSNGADITPTEGTTYKMKVGDTITLTNPNTGNYDIGKVYSFLTNQSGIISKTQTATSSNVVTVKAVKKGTVNMNVFFAGTKTVKVYNVITKKYDRTSTQTTTKEYVIQIIVE